MNGNKAGVALNWLSEQSWFDEFLPPERRLIQDTCQRIQLEYEGRCKEIQVEALHILATMKCSGKPNRNQQPCSRSTGSVEVLQGLKCIYDEFEEIESFALVTGCAQIDSSRLLQSPFEDSLSIREDHEC